MRTKKYALIIGILFIILLLVTLGVYYKIYKRVPIQDILDTSGPYDVNVSIKFNVTLEDNVKNFDSNIIRAARAAIFGWNANNSARRSHYKYSTNQYIDIFEILQIGSNTWDVHYRSKSKSEETYDTRFYQSVTVEKDKAGRYNGGITSTSPQDQGETY